MSAFDRNRLGVWHTNIASFKPTDTVTVAGYRALGVTDVFMNPHEVDQNVPEKADGTPNYLLTGPVSQGGTIMCELAKLGFHPQLFIDGTHTTDGVAIARLGMSGINRLNHSGAIQFDVEGDDDVHLAQTCGALVDAFRAAKPTFIYALSIVARKAYVMGMPLGADGRSVLDRMRNDPYAHLRIQQGLGNEEGLADLNDEIYEYVTLRGFPAARLSFTFAVCLVDPATGEHGQVILPGFFQGKVQTAIARGDIYNSNLLREKGLA